ncbi:MAG TPA: ion transporter [Rhodobacteraceae bacterium]|nr:ion transporter [Paracoccaceae bacterium]
MKRSDIIHLLDGTHDDKSNFVAWVMNGLIILSAIAIALETEPGLPSGVQFWLYRFEIFLLAVFALEYAVRIYASERPLKYIFSFWGIIDLLSFLPAIALLTPEWQAVRALRLIRLVRLLKLFRSLHALDRLVAAFREVRDELILFVIIAALMLYVSAVGIFIFEHEAQPESFTSIPMSLWWAVATFTTVGYGDMYPITPGGRIFTTAILFIGLGIVAVPAAIVTTALLEAETNIGKKKKNKKKKSKSEAKKTKPSKPSKGD